MVPFILLRRPMPNFLIDVSLFHKFISSKSFSARLNTPRLDRPQTFSLLGWQIFVNWGPNVAKLLFFELRMQVEEPSFMRFIKHAGSLDLTLFHWL